MYSQPIHSILTQFLISFTVVTIGSSSDYQMEIGQPIFKWRFDSTYDPCVHKIRLLLNVCQKEKSIIHHQWSIDVQLMASQISLMRKFLLCTYCRFALVNLFSPTVNLVPPPPYNWKWCSTTSIPINHSYLSVVYLILFFSSGYLIKCSDLFFAKQ